MTSTQTMQSASPDLSQLAPGLADPVVGAQSVFRSVLDAMSRPGSISTLSVLPGVPKGLNPAQAAFLVALADADTPIWFADPIVEAVDFLRFHCGCPITEDPMAATFAVLSDPSQLLPLDRFHEGEEAYPDRSATLLLAVPSLSGGVPLVATGPGVNGTANLAPRGLPDGFLAAMAENRAAYPCGIDLLLMTQDRMIGLPRTTRLTKASG